MTTENHTSTAPEAQEKSIDLFPLIVLVSYSILGFGFSFGIGAFGPEYPKGELSTSRLVLGVSAAALWPGLTLLHVGKKLGETLKTPE